MASNLLGFANIWLVSNQLMASSDSDFNISSKLVISLEVAYIVLSSAKLARLAFFMNKTKSFKNKLNSVGPNIEPCVTPEINIFNRLSMLFILIQNAFYIRRLMKIFNYYSNNQQKPIASAIKYLYGYLLYFICSPFFLNF